MRLDEPPVVVGVNVDHGGLCDKNTCLDVIVDGDLFLDIPSLACKMKHFQVNVHFCGLAYNPFNCQTLRSIRY